MEREHILSILYDLTLTIGGEIHLDDLLRKVLQRFLYHTAFPMGLVLLDHKYVNGVIQARLTSVIGDHLLELRRGEQLELPTALTRNPIELLNDSTLFAEINNRAKYRYCLKLPIDETGVILLLSPRMPASKLPLTQIFQPVLANLSRAILLCRNSERLTRTLETDRDQARAELANALERSERERMLLRSLNDTIPDLVWLKDPAGTYLTCNKAFEGLYGTTEAKLVGKTDYDFVEKELADFSRENDQAALKSDGPSVNEEWLTFTCNGYHGLFETIKTPLKKEDGSILGVLGIARDITLRKEAEDRIKQLAYYDSLTNLPNRRLLMDRLGHALLASLRSRNYGALLILDLDRFKILNDTRGHGTGDQLLKEVALRLVDTVRQEDTVARLGGDEFVILLENLDSNKDFAARHAELVAEKIRKELNKSYFLSPQEHEHHSTTSIGITLFSDQRNTAEALLKQADVALYQAKDSGRNTVRFYNASMQSAIDERMAMETALRQALRNNEFTLFYQSQVDSNGWITGAEALIRWPSPDRSMVLPDSFIPIAEETRLILPLGLWVLERACDQLKTWQSDPRTKQLTLAVNISALQFHQHDFADQIKDILHRYEINPAFLKLELTESALLEDIDSAIERLSRIKALGIGLALDDFGTGFSSLSYLKRLPLDQIKIDRTFVRDIAEDANDAAIVQAVISMCHHLGLNVIAEGVENQEQKAFLEKNGCRAFQGYLFGRPMPTAEWENQYLIATDKT
ncbi:MAG: EAL domain-containing protein, partial [Pseudomonadota bacterium]